MGNAVLYGCKGQNRSPNSFYITVSTLKYSPSAPPSAVCLFMLTDMHDAGSVISLLETPPLIRRFLIKGTLIVVL